MSKSIRLWATVTPELGEAVERKAARLRLSVPDMLRQIVAEAVADDREAINRVDERQLALPTELEVRV